MKQWNAVVFNEDQCENTKSESRWDPSDVLCNLHTQFNQQATRLILNLWAFLFFLQIKQKKHPRMANNELTHS